MRLEIDLREYSITTIPQYITEVDILTLNFQELSDEIEEFNKELNWDGMWGIEEVKNRLSNGWRFIIFNPKDKIKGWYWLDNTGEPRNIYVNKHYRGMGIAREMQFKLLNICKSLGMDRVECSIDDWNLTSMKSFKSTGWYEISNK